MSFFDSACQYGGTFSLNSLSGWAKKKRQKVIKAKTLSTCS